MTQEQEEAFKEVSGQIKKIMALMRSTKGLSNDVLSADIHNMLVGELQAKLKFAQDLTNGIYGSPRQ